MKVSVIIPFHKGLSFLEDCLQSLIVQSYEDFEIILVCDRVKEDVETFIEPYKTMRKIKILKLTGHKGVAAARNLGLTEATGDYIYFLDSDDYIGNTTLELLVTAAEVNNCEMVYGEKILTWFKRSLFMKNYISEDSESSEDEDEDGNNNSLDSAELNLENGGEAESSSSLNEEQLLKDDSVEEEQTENEAPMGPEAKKIATYLKLVTNCKGFRNISVLNILMKRSVIEENNIRFNEKIKFLSDYPFLLQVLQVVDNYEYIPLAIYMKRNHNDAINLPSLSQTRGSRSFKEYVATYRYAIGLIRADGDLRELLDRKLITYCIGYFAPKLIINKEVEEREIKFMILHQLIVNINLDLLKSYKGYRRKLLKAFYAGDVSRARKTVKRHLVWKKLKKITKNKRAFSKFLYMHFFLKKPMKHNWVFCESFFGKNYSDSPKYVYEYISKNYPGQFKFIWVINKKKTIIPYKHVKVKRFSFRYAYYLARSKYYVFNGRQPEWVRKRKGNIFLQTWHGTPLKRLVFDMEDISSARPRYKHQVYKQSRAWDYLIAPNKYSSDIFRRCFMYHKEMLETGYPRNDILHYDNKDQIAARIREKLGIPKGKKTILYAPTWRDDEYYTTGKYKFLIKLDLQAMKEKLGKEYVILLRTHYFIADSIDVTGLEDFAFNFSKYDDISELYLISDILITDYSSVFFDYANLKRPMLFFTYDLEKYRDILRGFYIDIEEELPGPLLFTTEEVITAVNKIDKLSQEYHQKYLAFYEKYCSWEDGTASEKVANEVFGLKGDLNEAKY